MTDFNSGFGKAGCHMENVGELLQQFDADYVTEDGNVIKLTGEAVLSLMGDLYGKLEETMLECEGKQLQIEFGDSAAANLIEQLIKFILQFSGNKK